MTAQLAAHIRRESTINGLTNALFNGVIAWALMKDSGPLQRWGEHSYGVDILATAFILPFIVALIVIPLQRKKRRDDKIPAFDGGNSQYWLHRKIYTMPNSLLLNALLFGMAGIIVVAIPLIAGMTLLDIQQVAATPYSVFKGIWAGLMAALLVGPMIMVATRDSKESKQ